MLKFEIINNENEFSGDINRDFVVDFLYEHLDQFGDTKSAISKCIDYAFSESEGKGGYVLIAKDNEEVVGILIMNNTGMAEYIPENILVYIAVKGNQRGKGVGRQIIEKAFEITKGNIALHVEYENPAKRLYERTGFTSKYAEMRYEGGK